MVQGIDVDAGAATPPVSPLSPRRRCCRGDSRRRCRDCRVRADTSGARTTLYSSTSRKDCCLLTEYAIEIDMLRPIFQRHAQADFPANWAGCRPRFRLVSIVGCRPIWAGWPHVCIGLYWALNTIPIQIVRISIFS